MSLENAILGFLQYHPSSGYDLKKIFDSSVRHFWPADQSQIYRTLRRLTKAGFVEMEKIPQEQRPDRKVYSISESGQAKLLKWLAGPTPQGEPHNAALLQVFFAGQLSDEEILAKFEGFAAVLRASLAQYNQIPAQMVPTRQEISSPRVHFFRMLTLDNAIRSTQASLEWAENVIEQLKQGRVPEK